MTWRVVTGDVRDRLRELDAESVQTCITSPPYWGLRDYGTAAWKGGDPGCEHFQGRNGAGRADGNVDERGQRNRDGASALTSGVCSGCGATRIDSQLGLEPTPEQYVENMVRVFREVRRVLRADGTLWLNLGDSYGTGAGPTSDKSTLRGNGHVGGGPKAKAVPTTSPRTDLKPKDLVGIPWMVAFALRADGWYLRSDIIWSKPNPMPESVTDRPTKSHEYLFLLAKQPRYFYDADAIRETDSGRPSGNGFVRDYRLTYQNDDGTPRGNPDEWEPGSGRNKRSVWMVTTQPFPGAHFATFPPKLIEPCILAGSPPKCCGECGAPWMRLTESEQIATRERTRNVGGRTDGLTRPTGPGAGFYAERKTTGWKATCYHADSPAPDDTGRATVLDPFAGAGTTLLVAEQHGRDSIGIELNPEYAEMARERIRRWEANPNGYLEAVEPIPGQESLL